MAMICTRIANLPCAFSSKAHKYKLEDFMPQKPREVKEQSPEELLAYMRIMNAALGGKEVVNG